MPSLVVRGGTAKRLPGRVNRLFLKMKAADLALVAEDAVSAGGVGDGGQGPGVPRAGGEGAIGRCEEETKDRIEPAPALRGRTTARGQTGFRPPGALRAISSCGGS